MRTFAVTLLFGVLAVASCASCISNTEPMTPAETCKAQLQMFDHHVRKANGVPMFLLPERQLFEMKVALERVRTTCSAATYQLELERAAGAP